jgi:nucleoside-diphosphate-sugar epimerase
VYGFAGPGPITEDTPSSADYNDYGSGKVACERLLAEAAVRSGRGGRRAFDITVHDTVMYRRPAVSG